MSDTTTSQTQFEQAKAIDNDMKLVAAIVTLLPEENLNPTFDDLLSVLTQLNNAQNNAELPDTITIAQNAISTLYSTLRTDYDTYNSDLQTQFDTLWNLTGVPRT